MRTVNFRDDVLWAVAFKLGLDPRKDLLSDQANAITSFINAWVRRLYDKFDWPEWTIIEERTPNGSHFVDYEETNKTPIGRVYKVYLLDPDLVRGPVDTPFRLLANGIHVGFDHGSTVFIKFTTRAPKFTAIPYDATKTYDTDDLAYSPQRGNCYKSVQDANTGNQLTDTDWWALQEFPVALADPVVRGAYSDALRDEGQTDKAGVEEQGAGQQGVERGQAYTAPDYDPLTDQQPVGPKYRTNAGGS